MRNAPRLVILGILLSLSLYSAGAEKSEPEAPSQPSASEEQETRLVDKVYTLDLRQKVCQLMVANLEGKLAPTPSDRALVRRYTPGAVVITNLLTPSGAPSFFKDIYALAAQGRAGIPPLIGADLQSLPISITGGRKDTFVAFPSWLSVAAADSPEATQCIADLLVAHLTGMGFTMHWGPSLALAPVLPEADGSIACLGSDPAVTSRIASGVLGALAEANILGVPTDFPGGAWDKTGKAPAVLLRSPASLRETDLLPFRTAIENGVPAIHVGTMLVPTLDDAIRPACLSPAVMRGLLRRELGFKGVILAGPMDSQTTAAGQSPIEAAILALNAGADMICWSDSSTRVLKAVESIVVAVKEGRIKPEVIDEAVTRVLKMKDSLGLLTREAPKAADAKRLEKAKDLATDAYRIERASITVLRNERNVLPLGSKETLPVGVTGAVGVEALHDALEKHVKLVVQQRITTARHGNDIYDFEIDRIVLRADRLKTVVCVFPTTLKAQGVRELLYKLKDSGVRVVAVVLGCPTTLSLFEDADAIVLAYVDAMACTESMKAVADVLVGQAPVGFLPGSPVPALQAGKAHSFSILDMVRTPAGCLPVSLEPPFVAGFSASINPEDAIKKVVWDFGDGKQAKDRNVEHAYEQAGVYTLTATVSDVSGDSSSRSYQVTVE